MIEEFKVLGDHRGQLVALETNRQIPFDVKRVFYIYGTQEGVWLFENSCCLKHRGDRSKFCVNRVKL